MTQTTADPATDVEHLDREASTTLIATDFLELASSGKAQTAWDRYGHPDFVHHNPWFPGDGPSLIRAMDENARANPGKELTVLRAIAQGPLVAIHSHVRHHADDRGAALVHIFRLEDGRIRELWDIAQKVPPDSPNDRGMF